MDSDAEDLYRRILSGEDFELTSIGTRPSTAERRPPPDAADEQQRRTRQRRSSVSSHDNYPLTPRNINIQRPQMPPTPSTPRQFSPRQLELGSAANTNASLATASSWAGRTTVNQRGTSLESTPDPAPDRRTRFLNLWQSVGPGTDGLFAAEGPLPNPLHSWGSAFSESTPRPGSATRLYSIPHYQMGSLTEPRITPNGSEDSW